MPGSHDVYVIEVDGEYRVRPAIVPVRAGQKFRMRNCLDHDVVFLFAPEAVARTGAVETVKDEKQKVVAVGVEIPAQDGELVSIKKSANGVYLYRVLVVKSPNKWVDAIGESGLRLIVNR